MGKYPYIKKLNEEVKYVFLFCFLFLFLLGLRERPPFLFHVGSEGKTITTDSSKDTGKPSVI